MTSLARADLVSPDATSPILVDPPLRRLRAEVLSSADCLARPVEPDPADAARPIFQQPWWLGIAQRGGSYGEVRLYQQGRCLGRFPFGLRRRFGITAVADADWSHLGGPIFASGLGARARQLCCEALVAALPRATFQVFVLPGHAAAQCRLADAFARHGFTHSTQETYLRPPEPWGELSEDEAAGRILQGFSRKRRMHLRQAERQVRAEEISPARFVAEYELNLPRGYAGLRKRPLASARRLLEAALARGQARILAARPATAPRHDAALACVWDTERYYYWMSTRRGDTPDGERPHPDAIKLLAVRALAHAQTLGLTFDTDGVVTPGAQHLYRDILGLGERVEHRHVFLRHTAISALYYSPLGEAVKDAVSRRLAPRAAIRPRLAHRA